MVRLQVVGMLVAVVDAVRRHDIRLVGLHERGEPVSRDVDGYGAECALVILVIPVRHAGVVVAEQLDLRHAQQLASLSQLAPSRRGHRLGVMACFARLDSAWAVAKLAVGAGDDDRADALCGVLC